MKQFHTHRLLSIAALSAIGSLASSALAQYSSDPNAPLAIVATAGDDVQPKIAPAPSDGQYISYFSGTGYDIFLELRSASGNAVWASPLLIEDRAFSSTTDYALTSDASGNAYVVYNAADPNNAAGALVKMVSVAPSGSVRWTSILYTSTLGATSLGSGRSGGRRFRGFELCKAASKGLDFILGFFCLRSRGGLRCSGFRLRSRCRLRCGGLRSRCRLSCSGFRRRLRLCLGHELLRRLLRRCCGRCLSGALLELHPGSLGLMHDMLDFELEDALDARVFTELDDRRRLALGQRPDGRKHELRERFVDVERDARADGVVGVAVRRQEVGKALEVAERCRGHAQEHGPAEKLVVDIIERHDGKALAVRARLHRLASFRDFRAPRILRAPGASVRLLARRRRVGDHAIRRPAVGRARVAGLVAIGIKDFRDGCRGADDDALDRCARTVAIFAHERVLLALIFDGPDLAAIRHDAETGLNARCELVIGVTLLGNDGSGARLERGGKGKFRHWGSS